MPESDHTPFRFSAEYLFTVVSAWLIPGAGHWVLGYRIRGALLAAVILGLFWAGQALAIRPPNPDFPRTPIAVSRDVSPIFFICQVGNAFSAILSNTLWGKPPYKDVVTGELDRHLPRDLNLGILFTSVSGLLNYLLVLHILDPRTWAQAQGARSRRPAGPEEKSPEAP
jgi:hypothetical protein